MLHADVSADARDAFSLNDEVGQSVRSEVALRDLTEDVHEHVRDGHEPKEIVEMRR